MKKISVSVKIQKQNETTDKISLFFRQIGYIYSELSLKTFSELSKTYFALQNKTNEVYAFEEPVKVVI